MDAKKALKKLKKQAKKHTKNNEAITKLKKLKKKHNSKQTQHNHALGEFKKELSEAANQAMINAAYELATPLKPVLSWFNDDNQIIDIKEITSNENNQPTSRKSNSAVTKPTTGVKSIIHLPLKSPPCKRCPALQSGICKCAAKRFKMSA